MPFPGADLDQPLRLGRCPRCDYNLSGNDSGTCPECGQDCSLIWDGTIPEGHCQKCRYQLPVLDAGPICRHCMGGIGRIQIPMIVLMGWPMLAIGPILFAVAIATSAGGIIGIVLTGIILLAVLTAMVTTSRVAANRLTSPTFGLFSIVLTQGFAAVLGFALILLLLFLLK